MYECGRQLHPLLIAQRQRLQLRVRLGEDVELLDEARRGRARIIGGHTAKLTEISDLVDYAHLRVEAARLGHIAHSQAGRKAQRLLPKPDPAGVSSQQPHGDPHCRGLAGAVRADEADDLAIPHL